MDLDEDNFKGILDDLLIPRWSVVDDCYIQLVQDEEYIKWIEVTLNFIEENFPEILQESVNKVKNAIQKEAARVWYENDSWGLLAMATGTGKSKIPIDILKPVAEKERELNVLLVVPTETLRDVNWLEEFKKWKAEYIYNSFVTGVCYASLDNIKDQEFDLVIGDEWHNMTTAKYEFFLNNKVKRLICLTATPPDKDDIAKIQINKALNLKTIYEVPLDIAVRLKLTSPYEAIVIECRLDDIIKDVPAGTKKNPFLTTEKKAYDYKTQLVNTAMYSSNPGLKKTLKFRILDRMRFLKNLDSLTKNAIFILETFIKPGERTLIFCGGIIQADKVSKYSFHSKKTNDKDFQDFKSKKISQLACVSALNEGQNIDDIETLILICPESSDKTITQQIGRGIRFAIGHTCKVIILIVTDTVSEKWFNSAITGLDPSKFRHVRFTNLLNGVEVI